jgi:hypothetical protein
MSTGIEDKKPTKKMEEIVSDDDGDFVFGNNKKRVDSELFKKINSILRDVVPSQSYVDSQQYKGTLCIYVYMYVYIYIYIYVYICMRLKRYAFLYIYICVCVLCTFMYLHSQT